MYLTVNAIVLLLSVTLLSTGCQKKKSNKRTAAKPTAAATTTSQRPLVDPPSEEDLERHGQRRADVDPYSPEASEPIVRNERPPARQAPAEYAARSDYQERPVEPVRRSEPAPRDFETEEGPRGPGPRDSEFTDRTGYGPTDGLGPQQPIDTTENGTARNTECGTAFRRSNDMWAPGLPNAPAKNRICTGGSVRRPDPRETFQCEQNPGIVFTDARQDGLMAMVVDRVNRLPRQMDLGSRELAQRVRDVRVHTDLSRTGNVIAEVVLLVANKTYEKIELRGRFKGSRGQQRADVRLQAVNSPRGLRFSAMLTCADVGRGCENGLLRLQQLTRSGKIGRVAYIVHRHGDAHVTISEQDRIAFRNIRNEGHARFAEYLSNTTYNTCVAVLRDAFSGVRQLPACAFQRLKDQCGRRAQFKQPAAKAFVFRSWAVAYGRSGFEFEMLDSQSRFSVKGPLVASQQTPVWPRPLTVKGALGQHIERAILVANDGGGNINLQIDFKGGDKAHTRVSVTTLIEDVRFSSEQIMAQAQQMPQVSAEEVADEREQQEEMRRAPAPPPRRTVAPAPAARSKVTAAPAAKPTPGAKPTPAKPAPAAKPPQAPAKATPAPAPAVRQEPAAPATPPPATPVEPREQDDNLTVQPQDDPEGAPQEAPTTPPPGSDDPESEEDLGAQGPE